MKKSILAIVALGSILSVISTPIKSNAIEVCTITVNNPPTNVRPWAGKDNKPVHVIKEYTVLEPLQTSGEWTFVEVWVAGSTYVKGWIHNSQYLTECYDQDVYSDDYWRWYDIADKARYNGDYNTALINYNRAKEEFLRLNPDKTDVSDELNAMILLMENKR
jgi:hypothetical protein